MLTSILSVMRQETFFYGAAGDGKLAILFFTVYTAKKQHRKFETNIPSKGIAQPQSQFPHSCVCERLIYSHDRSAYSAAGNMLIDPGNKSLTDA